MCDALSHNLPGEFKVVLAHCLAHSRRKFVDVVRQFPEECRYLLKTLAEVYRTDALSRQQGMSPDERLRFHQAKSGPPINDLERWLKDQLEEGKVEPNSGLGQAISYMKKHWGKLTMFLQVPGAPLDNNICERALKKVILHRKDSLFYKMGISFTHVGTNDSVGRWKAQGIPSPGLITLGRFRSSTRGLAARRRAGSISGGFAGRIALSAPTARQWASRGKCRAACCAVEPAIGRYR